MVKQTEKDVYDTVDIHYLTALASVKLLRETSVLDLTVDDYEFLVQSKLWLPIDRSRARRCVEACVYGALDYVGFARFPPPVEFVAAAIAVFVHPQNIQSACIIMEGCEFVDNVINGVESPVKANILFAHTLKILSGDNMLLECRQKQIKENINLRGG